MKLVKNIMVVACAASFMFAGVSFHMGNNYGSLDGGTTVDTEYGMTWDLNSSTGIGYDGHLGMMMYFTVPAGVTLRMGWSGANQTSLGLGFTWWSGGEGFKTSIGTSYDYVRDGAADSNNLSVSVGFGF
tara:strand:- start:26 stop:412 length:387 start_codon:yes stop_codon:yes gene_type:complete